MNMNATMQFEAACGQKGNMSLTTNFVYADDGLFYEDPVIESHDGPQWFLCFDDEDPPEFVMRVYTSIKTDALRQIAETKLKELGIGARIVETRRNGTRCFHGKFHAAIAFDLMLTRPIPASLLSAQVGRERPGAGAVWMCNGL